MTAEGTFPKIGGDVIYASEYNAFFYSTGTGEDGDFNETSGTTTLTHGTIYQYSSFNLGASATIDASGTSTKSIIILVSGDCTIAGTIDLAGKGCAGGATSNFGQGYGSIFASGGEGGNWAGASAGGASSQGSGGGNRANGDTPRTGGRRCDMANFQHNSFVYISNGTGGGATSSTTGHAGGCTILFIVKGDIIIENTADIDCSGTDSANDGGAGGSGDIILLHGGTYTDNGGTFTTDGGAMGGASDGGAGAAGQTKILKITDAVRF